MSDRYIIRTGTEAEDLDDWQLALDLLGETGIEDVRRGHGHITVEAVGGATFAFGLEYDADEDGDPVLAGWSWATYDAEGTNEGQGGDALTTTAADLSETIRDEIVLWAEHAWAAHLDDITRERRQAAEQALRDLAAAVEDGTAWTQDVMDAADFGSSTPACMWAITIDRGSDLYAQWIDAKADEAGYEPIDGISAVELIGEDDTERIEAWLAEQ